MGPTDAKHLVRHELCGEGDACGVLTAGNLVDPFRVEYDYEREKSVPKASKNELLRRAVLSCHSTCEFVLVPPGDAVNEAWEANL